NVILKPFGKQKGLAAIQAGTMIHALQTPSQANCSKNTIEFLHRLGHDCDHSIYAFFGIGKRPVQNFLVRAN
ncbi:MAG TPA: hypothetical protein VIK59_00065, partial [Verrucomicrobiae bacterium]